MLAVHLVCPPKTLILCLLDFSTVRAQAVNPCGVIQLVPLSSVFPINRDSGLEAQSYSGAVSFMGGAVCMNLRTTLASGSLLK